MSSSPGAGTPGAPEQVPREPFAWMSKDTPAGRYRFTLKSPTSEAVTGVLLIAAGVLFTVLLLSDPSGAATAVAVVLFVIFVGFGVLLVVMAIARRRWVAIYRRVHGYPPY